MRLLVTRPEPDDARFKAQLEALGHTVDLSPLIRIELSRVPPPAAGVAALVVTSQNALRALAASPAIEMASTLPVFCVGPGTAGLARSMGFKIAIEGAGTAKELVPIITSHPVASKGDLLVLTGDHRATDLGGDLTRAGFRVQMETVYRSIAATAFAPGVAAGIAAGEIEGVVLMSPRTARVYSALVLEAGLQSMAAGMAHFCLSEAVRSALDNPQAKKVSVAKAPNAQEMLALITRVAAKLD